MECFTRILKKMSIKPEFAYHYRCHSLKVTHLIFVDDLMMFCKDVLMIRAMKSFSQASGLSATNEKSAVYFGNVTEEMQTRMLQVTGFKKGSFPFRYLGVPSTSKRV